MVTLDHDAVEAVFVARLSPGGDMQDDFTKVLDALELAVAELRASRHKLAAAIILEPGHALPSAFARAKAAALTGREDFNVALAIVTSNLLIKGVLTALDWLRTKSYLDAVFDDVQAAQRWLEEQRGAALPRLAAILDRLRAASAVNS